MIGASGPSISMMQLSTPRPHSAAMTCSTVETKTPNSSPSTVASSVAVTEHAFARNSRSGSPLAPQRRKTMPVSASAGFNASVTGRPELIPAPAIAVRFRSVVCLPDFIARVPPSFDTECVHALDADPASRATISPLRLESTKRTDDGPPPPRRSTHVAKLNGIRGNGQFTLSYRLLLARTYVGCGTLSTKEEPGQRRRPGSGESKLRPDAAVNWLGGAKRPESPTGRPRTGLQPERYAH